MSLPFTVSGQEPKEPTEMFVLTGTIQTATKSNLELADCIANSSMIMGITAYTTSEKEAAESSFVEGNYAFNYFVNNYESQAGKIDFKYVFNSKDGVIEYKFYDFVHDGTNTNFKSIGTIPKKWNDTIGLIFTKDQFMEIMIDLTGNVALALRMIKENCVK